MGYEGVTMNEDEKKTTQIGTETWPLEVEHLETSVSRSRYVSLVIPRSILGKRTRLVNMSPRSALALRDWLIQESAELEQLAAEEVTFHS